jgi:hypothetical protein
MSTDQNDKKPFRPFANLDYKKTEDHFYDLDSFIKYRNSMEPAPTKLVKDMTIEEKLEKALDMAKKKLKVTGESEIFKFISFNNKWRILGMQRKNLRKNPELYLNTLKTQILDREPIEYPSANEGSIRRQNGHLKIDLNLIKTYAMANDTKKILELFDLPNKKLAKYELTKAIKNENKNQMIYWFEKLKEILSK